MQIYRDASVRVSLPRRILYDCVILHEVCASIRYALFRDKNLAPNLHRNLCDQTLRVFNCNNVVDGKRQLQRRDTFRGEVQTQRALSPAVLNFYSSPPNRQPCRTVLHYCASKYMRDLNQNDNNCVQQTRLTSFETFARSPPSYKSSDTDSLVINRRACYTHRCITPEHSTDFRMYIKEGRIELLFSYNCHRIFFIVLLSYNRDTSI